MGQAPNQKRVNQGGGTAPPGWKGRRGADLPCGPRDSLTGKGGASPRRTARARPQSRAGSDVAWGRTNITIIRNNVNTISNNHNNKLCEHDGERGGASPQADRASATAKPG